MFLLGDGLRWIGDGSRVDRGGRSRVDRRWIKKGSGEDQGRIGDGSVDRRPVGAGEGWITNTVVGKLCIYYIGRSYGVD